MGEVVTYLISGFSVYLLAYAGFFRISELLSIRRSNIVTEDLYRKIFIEVNKTDKYRKGTLVYIAKTGNFTCPYCGRQKEPAMLISMLLLQTHGPQL